MPIRIDEVDPPLGFGEVQALSLTRWKGDRSDPRLAALIDAVRACIAGKRSRPFPAFPAQPRVSRRAMVAGGIGVGVIAAGASAWLLFKPGGANARRIAVLPFANLSADPEQAYFSDGITEELRAALSRIGMEVIGRASSIAVKDLDAKAAAKKLGVAHILSGSVRRSPNMIRVNAQLVSGKDGVARWAQSYDRAPGDAIKIQTDIAENVARALSITLGQAGRAALALGGTSDSVAQDLVLRARERRVTAGTREEFDQALKLIDGAIARDPDYADAHVQRSTILTLIAENFPTNADEVTRQLAQAEAAAKRASEIAPKLGAAHAALARIAYNRLDTVGLLRQTELALALSPDDPDVLLDASTTLATLGRSEEGLRIADRLIALDGLNARAYARKSLVLMLMRRYPEVIEAVRTANEIAPGNPARNAIAGDAWLLLGQPEKARMEYAKMPPDDYLRLTGEAIAAARDGQSAEAERLIGRLRQDYGDSTAYQYAMIYAQLGDKDRAFEQLDKALALRDPGLVGLKTDAFLDPLRKDPRYSELVRKLHFP
jgi:serine/threonine-protein kinase